MKIYYRSLQQSNTGGTDLDYAMLIVKNVAALKHRCAASVFLALNRSNNLDQLDGVEGTIVEVGRQIWDSDANVT